MIKKQKWNVAIAFLIFIIAMLATGGWILNIVKLVHLDSLAFTWINIVRIIGVFFPPLGAILGYL